MSHAVEVCSLEILWPDSPVEEILVWILAQKHVNLSSPLPKVRPATLGMSQPPRRSLDNL